eukprot:TRINITY_DN39013_c0_g1_i1.p1 TRINITY_DN39013_c0_g1~~TRINITY_DN39013_c0_g1_i1.p1  ORF type:complete len:761 (-),score=124.38 TRINITY_DN39013_c0_g1_i1:58-2340(-)
MACQRLSATMPRTSSPGPNEALKAPRQHRPCLQPSSMPALPPDSTSAPSGSSGKPPEGLRNLGLLQDHVALRSAARLGSGSLGVVLLAQDRRTSQQLAVKVISLKLVQSLGAEESRVWREAQVMREVQHPNLVRLIDVLAGWDPLPHVTSEPPYLCIVMEYVADSEALSNTMRRSGPAPQLAERVVPQLASALAQMHKLGVVHRDVWSENVLYSEDGKAVLVDLGCAEYIGGRPAVNSKLNIPYMSPEAAAGMVQQTGDDCWALGLLITEMVTGSFVADRLGRSDVPIHFNRAALSSALTETSARGGPLLNRLTSQLLDFTAARRLQMADVLDVFRPTPCSSGNGVAPCHSASGSEASGTAATNSTPNGVVRHSLYQPPAAASSSPPPAQLRPQARPSRAQASPQLNRGRISGAASPSPVRMRVAGDASPPRNPGLLATMAASNGRVGRGSFGCKSTSSSPAGVSAPPVNYQPGQTVLYCPRSHAGIHKATVLGRSADGNGWRIAFEHGGVKEVEDSEDWRLCLCDLPSSLPTRLPERSASPLRRSGTSVAVAPDVRGADEASSKGCEAAGGSLEAVAAQASTAAAGPKQVKASPTPSLVPISSATTTASGNSGTATTNTIATSVGSTSPAGEATLCGTQQAWLTHGPARCASPTMPAAQGLRAYMSSPPLPVAGAMAPGGAAAPRHGPPYLASQPPIVPAPASALQPGRRILYTARTNGQRYPGVVVGLLGGRPGYRLFLDCGEAKEVEEAECWRIALL